MAINLVSKTLYVSDSNVASKIFPTYKQLGVNLKKFYVSFSKFLKLHFHDIR